MALQSDKLVQTLENGEISDCEQVLKVFNKQVCFLLYTYFLYYFAF